MGNTVFRKGARGLLNTRVWSLRHARAWLSVFLTLPALASALHEAPPRQLVLWAWERPEDLRFLNEQVEVAYLSRTVDVRSERAIVQRRRQPLSVNESTRLIGVVRVERPRRSPILVSATQVLEAVELAVRETLSAPRTNRIQIDFDARVSERSLYRALMQRLRERFPNVAISVTSLASWCESDAWLATLEPDEIVPMAFAMGDEGPNILYSLHERGHFAQHECRASLGVSPDENIPPLGDATRIYAFSSRSWNQSRVARLSEVLR